jgi:hypothetical protein
MPRLPNGMVRAGGSIQGSDHSDGLEKLDICPGPTANTTLQGLPPACRIPGVVPKRVS